MIFLRFLTKKVTVSPNVRSSATATALQDSVDAEKQWQKEYGSQLEHQCPQKRDCSRYQSVV